MKKPADTRLERDIQAAIIEAVRQPEFHRDVVLWTNVIGDFFDARGNRHKVGVANPGGSDLVGMFTRSDGSGLWIGAEIKSATGRQSDEQKAHEHFVRSRGGKYALLRSVDDAVSWIERLRRGEP